MELTLEHAPLSEDQDPDSPDAVRLCACGCGESLRDGAKRAYIRGHKSRADAEKIDPDPEPGDESRKRVYRASAKIKKEMQDTLEAYGAMLCAGWALRDPLCGNVALEVLPATVEKLVPILARNQVAVKYFTTSNNFREVVDVFVTLFPLVQVITAHHLFHSVGTPTQEQNGEVPNYNGYVA